MVKVKGEGILLGGSCCGDRLHFEFFEVQKEELLDDRGINCGNIAKYKSDSIPF